MYSVVFVSPWLFLVRYRPVTKLSKRLASADPALACLVLGVVVLGHALQIANGFYDPAALAWLTGALALCAAGASCVRSPAATSSVARVVLSGVMAAGIAWQVATLLTASPGIYLEEGARLVFFKAGVFAEVALICVGVAGIRPLQRYWFPALLVTVFMIGVWMMHASPSPFIDVGVVHRAAIRALVRGRDPYRVTFQNIYGADSGFYNPEAIVGNRVAFGYPYPPISLLLAVPGQAFGDYRYAELAALVIAAGLIGYARPALTPKLASSLLLTTPRVFFVLEQGWTEPIAVLLLALTVFCLMRKPSLAPWAAGLLIVGKQYLALAAVPLLRLATSQGAGWRRFVLNAALAGLVVTLPFALWHPRSFIENVVVLQFREPFRFDSLSYLSWAARAGWGTGSFLWPILAAVLVLIADPARSPNTPAGFAVSVALASLAMFAFGSKAFCNYYFFVVGAMCCAIAALPDRR